MRFPIRQLFAFSATLTLVDGEFTFYCKQDSDHPRAVCIDAEIPHEHCFAATEKVTNPPNHNVFIECGPGLQHYCCTYDVYLYLNEHRKIPDETRNNDCFKP
ncbi:hypothetical protein MJO29_014023 [Puccinia striiformis f. sp. tritici]|uniref:hypothetical protein n=1 Tax=Puccinia striiformis f. sp. tritici TaxID=168172 RepID=UPI002008C9E5|nr:hypothetical protein Pst134EA_026629 [Puccinia striiformis f. sp. tritici]KAH9449918.1 hypothetical protein Pst134EA_026629 [Puccinia striiformis f. sp. tritici]KAI7939253.1 hypothetical protein MJO29_013989 [Puccinia striiformis f. sp. tritici]KAI7939287.1 hypothetical protein MJO29_014023 [Puccinia striiformis f. sp. tritici]